MSGLPKEFGASEREMLLGFLDYLRDGLVERVEGLSDEEARRSPVGSGTTLVGLVRHLADVETWWFREVFGDERAFPPGTTAADAWQVEHATVADAVAAYREAIARSNEIVRAAPSLDEVAAREGMDHTLRWIVVHMVEETGRHAGHADIIRELRDDAMSAGSGG